MRKIQIEFKTILDSIFSMQYVCVDGPYGCTVVAHVRIDISETMTGDYVSLMYSIRL